MSAKLINGTTQPSTMPNPKPGGDPLPSVSVAFDGIQLRVVRYCVENNIPLESTGTAQLKDFKDKDGNFDEVKLVNAFNDGSLSVKATKPIPADAVTASGSGLDPHISPENADIQAQRVADARKVPVGQVKKLIADNTDGRDLGILGEPGVNLIDLNLALDKLPAPTTKP
jgi:hypothetical protein